MRSMQAAAAASSPTRTTCAPSSKACYAFLAEGDTLVVPSLDRYGRCLKGLVTVVAELRERGVGFTSLHENLDTTTPGGRPARAPRRTTTSTTCFPQHSELGLTFYPVGSQAGQEATARALAPHKLAGELTPREFTFRIHQRHGHELPLTERLAELDDEYDILEYGDRTVDQVDAEVMAEARRLAAHPAVPAEPTDLPS
ncbi:recombinase family protein [Streptomyces atroolivaceus]|uniref:recombinase family protein n=1 Tax=Streptomyces atroolivaceus TaxID=66869 RepID=UPI0037A7305C